MEPLSHPTGDRLGEIVHDRDFIVVYRGLDQASCRAVIEHFDRDPGKWRGRIGGAGASWYEDEAKVSWDLEILDEGSSYEIFQRIHPKILACLADYLSRSPILQSFELTGSGYKVQMYPKGQGHFRWHADAVGKHGGDRVVAMVLYLNDVERGGETEFFHQRIKFVPRAGHLLLFPAAWNYMHCGHTPESGHKYIISTFIKVKAKA
ncbi:MAG: 2OG-Fe(II) oxygenase [Solimonas sp.]